MKKTSLVSILAGTVLCLISAITNQAVAASSSANTINKLKMYPQNKSVVSADQIETEKNHEDPKLAAVFLVSRNRSLVDFEDSSRNDGIDYLFKPTLKTDFGNFSTKIAYSQNLREVPTTDAKSASDWADVPFTFSFTPYKWLWTPPYVLAVTPSITAVMPASQISIRRDQLQTALSAGISFALIPDGIAVKKDGAWNLGLALTAGRAFHPYEENINGSVLNKYTSNQTLSFGYTYKKVSLSTEYIHKMRWSYQGNLRDSFELSEEVGYDITDMYSIALGHTNAGSSLKDDGSQSNFNVVNENASMIYLQLGISF